MAGKKAGPKQAEPQVEHVEPVDRMATPIDDGDLPEYPRGGASIEQVRDYVIKSAALVVKEARREGQYPAALAGLKLIAEVRGVPIGSKDVKDYEVANKVAAGMNKDAIFDAIASRIKEYSGRDDGFGDGGNRRDDRPLLEH